ncbi:MAG TPA: FHA domain-containing protein [Planctomycetaceae bacterium]|nr:FHA domain-containing protein [Planctomycetaceae bacterium]HRA90009.1 FHA domain-containing protein [Planctomycetaceae bacterium]
MARLTLKSVVFEDGDIQITENDLPVTLGRSHRADITINDMLLSRIHAEIRRGENGGFVLVDRESTNLTIVNNHDIRQSILQSGDCLLLGETQIIVEIDAPNIDMHEKTTRELSVVEPPKPATSKLTDGAM